MADEGAGELPVSQQRVAGKRRASATCLATVLHIEDVEKKIRGMASRRLLSCAREPRAFIFSANERRSPTNVYINKHACYMLASVIVMQAAYLFEKIQK